MATSLGIHPDELSRRISEIDLTSLRSRPGTQPEKHRGYTAEELLELRSENHDDQATTAEGLKTPPEVPAPPPSPHHEPTTLDEPPADTEQLADAPREEQSKKKKQKKKSSGKNKKPSPTGYEEFYADPPTTPDEHDEESELYASTRPFPDRIQTCIQRYRKRRNLNSTRANILTKYLMLGGVEASTTKQFTGGLDKDTLESSTTQEIAAIQATDFIRSGNAKYFDPIHPENWVVDFEGVAKGFFSCTVPKRLPIDTEEDIETFCGVIRNFLNYILLHAVCPEYTEDVLAARRVCILAEEELWEIKQVRYKLPGEFNIAASTLYGGRYQNIYSSDQGWATDDHSYDDPIPNNRGYSVPEAERIFKTGVAFEGTEELFLEAMNGDIHIVKTETRYFEVVQVDRVDTTSHDDYSKVKNHLGVSGSINALGRIHFKPWDGPGLDEEDLTDDEDAASSPPLGTPTTETFWLEDHILHHCFVGMKLELVVHSLNIGIRFFDDVLGIYCSFHTSLPNEKVIDNWKEPVPNTRPPPTEDNPDSEETAMHAAMQRELDEDEKQLVSGKSIEIKISDSTPAGA